ncbi:putative proline-tRNA ligase [Ceraceosorus guamensis]|uniref:proline--tRNA ligase n=1 Tax=Ceraceosorus guamensis TaxID=1522189 RepID=A0A316W7X1_9BASI|nr:putative proline-tRNA ligase [Ceraceosorus guamensis]PWN43765.1 putative proline-tRNA ligase [Ceraceosorus guamensis]
MEALSSTLSKLSITAQELTHASVTSPSEWATALKDAALGKSYVGTKTLVFKPKSKAAPVPLVIIFAKEDAEFSSANVGKAIGHKEMRLAAPDALLQYLSATKDDVSPLSLSSTNAAGATFPVQLVVDSALVSSSEPLAVHAKSDKESLLISYQGLRQVIESTGAEVKELDLASLAGSPAGAPAAKSTTKAAPSASAQAIQQAKADAKIADAELIGINVRKDGDFSEWYQQVLKKGDMLEYYDVSGCYILKPASYSVWQAIQTWFDAEIKKLGVENCYFPMFVSSDVLEREKDHIEGFAPEVAWVTKAGSSDLEKPVAIRPTSETVMYPYYAKWIRSHRDLPLKLNQWNSVVRWEFKHPQPFLRTREFLWQEGHTAHMTLEEADVEVKQILDLYRRVYEELLAVPVVPGVKSEKEKFAGGYYTTTVEGFVPTTGRGIQGGTSHCLGQNFSKMFNITVEDPKAPDEIRGKPEGKLHVWQNSWGLSTRTIGVMVMVHGDNQGLVMPPRVAQIQVIVVPVGITSKTSPKDRDVILDACAALEKTLKSNGLRAKADLRDNYNPGYKFADWELRGVPVRLEIGPKDLEKQQVLSVRRDNGARAAIPSSDLVAQLPKLLDQIHKDMFDKADKEYRSRRKVVTDWNDFTKTLNSKCHVVIPWCEVEACEDAIKDRSARNAEEGAEVDERAPSMGAKSLCIPFDQAQFGDVAGKKCPQCGSAAKRWTMFGRSY